MSDHPELNMESLAEWAREALEASAGGGAAARSALAHRGTQAWPLLLEAAVVGGFLPRQLAPDAAAGKPRGEAERTVLDFAETTREPDGVRWSLTRAARAEVLGAALGTPELDYALKRTAATPDFAADPVSRGLRDCLRLGQAAAERPDLEALEATRIAAVALAGVPGVVLPELDDLDREIEFRRLMAQFQRMVGRRPSGDGAGQNQYFFGRANELEQLRGYVGVIEAGTASQTLNRGLSIVSRALRGRAPLAVWGVGGAGKTTLISKFMLEHAEAAASRFPFAYLDFDRTTVSARQKSGLLAEMCLQTGAQFKELSGPMAELRARVQRLGGSLEASGEFESVSLLANTMHDFRRLVDDHFNSLEGEWSLWRRPFLLVFDTFEVVQYREDGVMELEAFVRGFSLPQEAGLWPRLRLIISGRKKVEEFITKVEELPVGALDPRGSAELLEALAGDFGRPISRAHAEALVTAVAGVTGERGGGVQPLRLRLIGEVFRDPKTQEDGPAIARSLVQELGQPLHADGRAAQVFIDGVLIRRVLGHVSDPRVAALADPGLVVRYITPDVIRNVMAPATPRPKTPATEKDVTPESLAPAAHSWKVDEKEAEEIFEAFRREVTLVEPEGRALRHRADVRQQMLGLIKARHPEQFEKLHRLAFKHFRRLAELIENDHASAAEAVYHGLWLGEPLEDLNRLWPGRDDYDTRIDPDEFEPGSPANVFVRAKTRAALKSQEVLTLPGEVALEWLDRRSGSLLNERRVENAIETIRAAAGHDYEALDERPATAATLARLLYRAGLWDEAAALALRHTERAANSGYLEDWWKSPGVRGGDPRGEALLSLTRTLATIIAKSEGSPDEVEFIAFLRLPEAEPLPRVEINAYAAVAMLQAGLDDQKLLGRFQSSLYDSAHAVREGRWRREQRVLRLAILTRRDAVAKDKLLKTWVKVCDRLPRSVTLDELSRLLSQVFPGGSALGDILHVIGGTRPESAPGDETRNKLDELWRREKEAVLKTLDSHARPDVRHALRTLIACDHSDWTRPLGNALTRTLKGGYGEELIHQLEGHNFLAGVTEKHGFSFFGRKSSQRRQRDGVAIVQLAEDAGRLLDLASLLKGWDKLEPGAANRRTLHPQHVSGISRALLRWNKLINKYFVSDRWPPPAR